MGRGRLTVAVLDSSAILALLNQEPGSQRVVEVLSDAAVSTVNCAEVFTKLDEWKMPAADFETVLRVIPTIVDFDFALARRVGELRTLTRHLGLSLGDRACLALAEREGGRAMTAERKWRELDVGIAIELIR